MLASDADLSSRPALIWWRLALVTDRGKLSRELLLDWIARNDPRIRRLG